MNTAVNSLNDAVLCAINGIEAGDSKREAVKSITTFVEANYIDKAMLESLRNMTLADAEMLYSMGYEVHLNDGRVTGLSSIR